MKIDSNNTYYFQFKGTKQLLRMTTADYADVGGYYIELGDDMDRYCEWQCTAIKDNDNDEIFYQIINPATGFSMDNNGMALYGHKANNGYYQQWKLIETCNGCVLQNRQTSAVLAVQNYVPTIGEWNIAPPYKLWGVVPVQNINAYVYPSDGTTYDFPEQTLESFTKRPNTGICFSGGGNRALTAAMGQLRGLNKLNLIDNIRYISCVSGGSWACTAFTYYNKGAKNDEELLGPVTSPGNITLEYLSEPLDENCIGYSATRQGLLLVLLAKSLIDSLTTDETLIPNWDEMIGEYYFKRFGIFDPAKPSYFSLNTETVADIRRRNPHLSEGIAFNVTRENRPYLIINSTMIAPSDFKIVDDTKTNLAGFEYTPLYIGSPFGQNIEYSSQVIGEESQNLYVGGGFVEPFAFGGLAPTSAPGKTGMVSLPNPISPFTLADASGTSSMAFAELIKEVRSYGKIIVDMAEWMLKNVFRVEWGNSMKQWFTEKSTSLNRLYWPVGNYLKQPATLFTFGDGGLVDNNGIFSLLVRKVGTIVIFVNTETPLNLDYDPTKAPDSDDIDPSISSLFGWPYDKEFQNFSRNTVFNKSDFTVIVRGLQEAKKAGRTVMVTTELDVVDNQWWGIEDGWNVKVCWVYNERVNTWEALLSGQVSEEIEKGKTIKDFPYYPCATHFELSVTDVKLLADLSCWNITQNEETFRTLLS